MSTDSLVLSQITIIHGVALASFCLAIASLFSSRLRTYSFGTWVLTFVLFAYLRPDWFQQLAGMKATGFVVPLIQVAMFGMGVTLTFDDFRRVLRLPHAIAIGVILQFLIMPGLGFLLATASGLPPELAAGVILIGACPGGVSSNVITYLARGNVALSVTMTACSTLLSPLMMPLAMSLLAGRIVEVPFWGMMSQIVWIVLTPIFLGVFVNWLLQRAKLNVVAAEVVSSLASMVAICFICAIIMADAHDSMQKVGLALLVVVAIHNLAGFFLGYWLSRLMGLSVADGRTVAIEVGMQNGGLGATLAQTVLHSPAMALPSVLFATWMNLSGSLLAAYWRGHLPDSSHH